MTSHLIIIFFNQLVLLAIEIFNHFPSYEICQKLLVIQWSQYIQLICLVPSYDCFLVIHVNLLQCAAFNAIIIFLAKAPILTLSCTTWCICYHLVLYAHEAPCAVCAWITCYCMCIKYMISYVVAYMEPNGGLDLTWCCICSTRSHLVYMMKHLFSPGIVCTWRAWSRL